MKIQITITELEMILGEMKRLQIKNPKARVVYDIERMNIYITYPLPKDFGKISKVEF